MNHMNDFQLVPPILPHEEQDWKDARSGLLKNLSPEQIDALSHNYVTRYVRGSAFVKEHDARISRIIGTVQSNLAFRAERHADHIFELEDCEPKRHVYKHLDEFKKYLWPTKYIGKTFKFNLEHLEEPEKLSQAKGLKIFDYKSNRSVLVIDLSETTPERVHEIEEFKNDDVFIQYVCFVKEVFYLKLEHIWKSPSRSVFIIDISELTTMNYWNAYKAGLPKLFKTLGENYPETTDRLLVLNPPLIFSWCFNMVKGMIQPDTLLKIRLLRGKKAIRDQFEKEGIDLKALPKSILQHVYLSEDEGKLYMNNGKLDAVDYVLSDNVIKLSANESKRTKQDMIDAAALDFKGFEKTSSS